VAPGKTPKEILDFWNRARVKALNDPEVKAVLDKQGLEPAPGSRDDLAPATQIINTYQMLAVNPEVPANSVRELVAVAHKMGGKMNFGSTGLGSSSHLAGELFKREAKIDALHVPYKGDAQLQPAILANDVQFVFVTPTAVLPHLKTGKLRVLAMTGSARASVAPDVPTMAEAGFPGVEMTGWIGILGTGGTPREVLVRVSEATAQALKMPDVAPRVPSWGGDAAGTTPDEFAARYRGDIAKFGRIMREAKIPYAD
jgi:tripartite-type tricarboxylate transporter receptor subunit TctC